MKIEIRLPSTQVLTDVKPSGAFEVKVEAELTYEFGNRVKSNVLISIPDAHGQKMAEKAGVLDNLPEPEQDQV